MKSDHNEKDINQILHNLRNEGVLIGRKWQNLCEGGSAETINTC